MKIKPFLEFICYFCVSFVQPFETNCMNYQGNSKLHFFYIFARSVGLSTKSHFLKTYRVVKIFPSVMIFGKDFLYFRIPSTNSSLVTYPLRLASRAFHAFSDSVSFPANSSNEIIPSKSLSLSLKIKCFEFLYNKKKKLV